MNSSKIRITVKPDSDLPLVYHRSWAAPGILMCAWNREALIIVISLLLCIQPFIMKTLKRTVKFRGSSSEHLPPRFQFRFTLLLPLSAHLSIRQDIAFFDAFQSKSFFWLFATLLCVIIAVF